MIGDTTGDATTHIHKKLNNEMSEEKMKNDNKNFMDNTIKEEMIKKYKSEGYGFPVGYEPSRNLDDTKQAEFSDFFCEIQTDMFHVK